MTMLTVFLVDDHEVVRRQVTALLNEAADLTVVGAAATAAQALTRVPAVRPDVAVLDLLLPDGNGVALCRELRSRLPELQCLMLTSDADEQAMMDAFLAGAAGFVIKDITGVDLIDAVRMVGSGRSLLDQRAATALLTRLRTGTAPPGPLSDLTEQERAKGLFVPPRRCLGDPPPMTSAGMTIPRSCHGQCAEFRPPRSPSSSPSHP